MRSVLFDHRSGEAITIIDLPEEFVKGQIGGKIEPWVVVMILRTTADNKQPGTEMSRLDQIKIRFDISEHGRGSRHLGHHIVAYTMRHGDAERLLRAFADTEWQATGRPGRPGFEATRVGFLAGLNAQVNKDKGGRTN